jgi:hypothetical protein
MAKGRMIHRDVIKMIHPRMELKLRGKSSSQPSEGHECISTPSCTMFHARTPHHNHSPLTTTTRPSPQPLAPHHNHSPLTTTTRPSPQPPQPPFTSPQPPYLTTTTLSLTTTTLPYHNHSPPRKDFAHAGRLGQALSCLCLEAQGEGSRSPPQIPYFLTLFSQVRPCFPA